MEEEAGDESRKGIRPDHTASLATVRLGLYSKWRREHLRDQNEERVSQCILTASQINTTIICCYTERRCKGTPADTEVELGSSGDNPLLKVKATN